MGTPETTTSVSELIERIGTPAAPRLFDVRRRAVFDEAAHFLPGAKWRDHRATADWATELPAGAELVVYCVHGHNVSRCATAALRQSGLAARTLDGGIEAWIAAGGPTLLKNRMPDPLLEAPGCWLTGERPTVRALTSLWLIRRWIDPDALVLRLDESWIAPSAEDLSALPFAVEGVGPADAVALAARFGLAIRGLDRLSGPALDGAVALTARGLAGPEHGLAILDGLHAAQRWARAA